MISKGWQPSLKLKINLTLMSPHINILGFRKLQGTKITTL